MKFPKELVEALKELVRTGLIAVIPVLIDGLSAGAVDLRLAGIAGGIAILRAIDKWLHLNDIKSPLDLEWVK